MNIKHTKWILTLLLFIIILIVAITFSLTLGEANISLFKIPGILFSGKVVPEFEVLRNIRIPRIILGISIGGALSLAGVILQGIYRNPLVEPYTLGISGGAALGVSLAIVLGVQRSMGSLILPISGFAGALVTIFIVYSLSIRRGNILVQNMVLIGVMISYIASSGMMFLMATSTSEDLHSIVFWVMGSLDEADSRLTAISCAISVLSLFATYLLIEPLNALRLGEEKARHLGVNTELSIRILFIIASLLTGMCVSVAGVIGFVGLIIPQFVRIIVGSDFRILIISSFVVGASFLVFCDMIARIIVAPNELPIGVITGIVGGLSFIIILNRSYKRVK